jgi:hypothetical protein
MEQRIFKFHLPIDDTEFEINIPAGAQLLTVQVQQGKPVLWAVVTSQAEVRVEWHGYAGLHRW